MFLTVSLISTAMMYDLAIQGGTVITADDTFEATVVISDGQIAGFIDSSGETEAERTVDATDKHIIPGGVDPHVHMMDPGDTHREDFQSGTAAAAAGGITTVGDQHRHPKDPPVIAPEILREKRDHLNDRSRIDYGLIAGGHPENIDQIEGLEADGALAYKSFTCNVHGVPALQSDYMMDLYKEISDVGGISMVHPEDERILNANKERVDASDRTDGSILPDWHSKEAEQVACATTIRIAKQTETPFWFAHLSHPEVVNMVTQAKSMGVNAYAETCARYLYMTVDDVVERAPWIWFTPPPRSDSERQRLWQCLDEGEIDMVNADHAPAPKTLIEQGEDDVREAPFHYEGLETVLPLLLNGVNEEKLGLNRVVEVFSTNPAKITGLYPQKGGIRIGSDADFVIIDMDRERTLRNEDVVTKCGWTPYNDLKIKGIPEATYVRGEPVFSDGEVVGEPGYGEFVSPDRSTTPWS